MSMYEQRGAMPSKFELMKQMEATKKEASELVEITKREANAPVEAMDKQIDEKRKDE